MKKKFELDMSQFTSSDSNIPITIQIRLELEKLGMKFTDSGELKSIINKNPTPLGTITYWEQPDRPHVRFYTQEI